MLNFQEGEGPPKVTLCMPCLNMKSFVVHAVKSIIAQTFTDWELVFVDDGSTDGSSGLVAAFADPRISIHINVENRGVAASLTYGQTVANGEIFIPMSADDAIDSGYLAEVVQAMADEKISIVTCQEHFMDVEGAEIPHGDLPKFMQCPPPVNATALEWRQNLYHAANCNFGVTAYRASLLREMGPFDESFRQLQDLEMLSRCLVAGHAPYVIEKKLAWFRIRPGQRSEATAENGEHHIAQLERIRAAHFRKKMKIMFSTPFYENKGYSPYIRSMLQSVYALARHTKLEFDYQDVAGGSYIDHNRNLMADMFLRSDCTHLFFIDSDESWDVAGLMRVVAADKDVVGAAYPVKNNWENYGVTIHTNADHTPEVDAKGLIRADKVPTGFMKIKREVFERIKAANPDDWYWNGEHEKLHNFFGHLTIDHVRYGEDISFNIRWQAVGGELWVEPRVQMGHYGAQGWYGNYDKYLRSQPGGDLAGKPDELKAA